MPGKIIVATDGSDTGNRAVDYAAALSDKFDQPLVIVHVLLFGRPKQEFEQLAEIEGLTLPKGDAASKSALTLPIPSAEDELATAKAISALGERIADKAKRRAKGVGARDVTVRVCAGDIADEILDVAEADEAEVLVIGHRGLGRLREVILGSVSQKVLHHADCTVTIVH